eukprot:354314-Chlamydomonas_euryale.AAC.4
MCERQPDGHTCAPAVPKPAHGARDKCSFEHHNERRSNRQHAHVLPQKAAWAMSKVARGTGKEGAVGGLAGRSSLCHASVTFKDVATVHCEEARQRRNRADGLCCACVVEKRA